MQQDETGSRSIHLEHRPAVAGPATASCAIEVVRRIEDRGRIGVRPVTREACEIVQHGVAGGGCAQLEYGPNIAGTATPSRAVEEAGRGIHRQAPIRVRPVTRVTCEIVQHGEVVAGCIQLEHGPKIFGTAILSRTVEVVRGGIQYQPGIGMCPIFGRTSEFMEECQVSRRVELEDDPVPGRATTSSCSIEVPLGVSYQARDRVCPVTRGACE